MIRPPAMSTRHHPPHPHGAPALSSQPPVLARADRPSRQSALPEAKRLVAARALVAASIGNSRLLLQQLTPSGGQEAMKPSLRRLGQLQGLAKQAPSLQQLRGLEGAAAATGVRLLGSLLEGDGFGFAVRSRRLPLTPFDALDALGDAMLRNAFLARLERHGLDPAIGLWPRSAAAGAALVADLSPAMRAHLLDPFHVRLIRARQLRPGEHFAATPRGLSLNASGRRLWLDAWTPYMAEASPLADGNQGPRWDVLDQLVRSYALFVDDPTASLLLPALRHEPPQRPHPHPVLLGFPPQPTAKSPTTPTHRCRVQSTSPLRTIGS